ncbi:inorganic pyrophosphatase [Cladorrhinum samala]|uniref:Inorganic pyrophosphatase n=1 Tax=Cladorrhinum samala TaxID=585594 RepID=A0AAV9HJT6_9PEZI|nr:inorganic pyrophosphatase [Cladorrhinum samala]
MLVRVDDSAPTTGHKLTRYSLRRAGRPFTKDYKVYFERINGHHKIPVSPFHDIPLYHDEEKKIFNMVVEVPRFTNAKFEISRTEFLNPITQDTDDGDADGTLRFNRNVFPYKGYLWNYGALPQTWENPNYTNPDTGERGDNDPIDACEIGRAIADTGDVKQVKVLGVLGLIDQKETDWKLIVIDVKDPLADEMKDINDVERHFPGLLGATRDWFRVYKIPEGHEPNGFAFGGMYRDKKYALKMVGECNEAWKGLVRGKIDGGEISLKNTTLSDTPGKLDPGKVELPPDEDLPPAHLERKPDEWFFVDRNTWP